MPSEVLTTLPIISIVISISILIGGFVAFRSGYSNTVKDLTSGVVETLKTQNEVQARQIASLEKEIERLKGLVQSIQFLLKQQGLKIEVSGDTVSVTEEFKGQTHTTQIKLSATDTEADQSA